MTPAECCRKCEHRAHAQDGTGHVRICKLDGVRDGLHWDANYCPIACFGTCAAPAGWSENPALVAVTVSAQPAPDIPIDLLTDDERVGLGDVVAAGIKAVGLDVLAKAWAKVTGLPCGCEKRKQWLNRLASWRRTNETK